MSSQNGIREVMKGLRLVPVVTFNDMNTVDAFAEFLLSQEVKCIEITLRTEYGLQAIAHLKKSLGDEMLVGAGTVTTPEHIAKVEAAGGDFIVSPGLTPKLAEAFVACKTPYLPGVSTASEIMQAREFGLDTLKFFPAHLFGGINGLKTYGSVFPDIMFCPTGGITKESSSEFLALSNVFAVGGSWFQKDFDLK